MTTRLHETEGILTCEMRLELFSKYTGETVKGWMIEGHCDCLEIRVNNNRFGIAFFFMN